MTPARRLPPVADVAGVRVGVYGQSDTVLLLGAPPDAPDRDADGDALREREALDAAAPSEPGEQADLFEHPSLFDGSG